jgi:hypothetical protein
MILRKKIIISNYKKSTNRDFAKFMVNRERARGKGQPNNVLGHNKNTLETVLS